MLSQPKPDSYSIDTQLLALKDSIEQHLSDLVPSADVWPRRLHEAERHALLSPGKRFRPLLCVLTANGVGIHNQAVLDLACVTEMVHAASLILDDLPCMDDADLRRSQPTIHVVFDESTAVLAATALLNRAFGVISRMPDISASIRVELVDMLSRAVGSKGLIAGQMADLVNDDPSVSAEDVETFNRLKTGALFDFAILGAAKLAGADAKTCTGLQGFSEQLGLAFQLLDDMKDEALSEIESGKTAGRDAGKMTLLALAGNEAASKRLREYLEDGLRALRSAQLSNTRVIETAIQRQFAFIKS